MPVPNWHAVGENIQYLAAMGVTSYFGESDNGAGHIAEMDELRAQMAAQHASEASAMRAELSSAKEMVRAA